MRPSFLPILLFPVATQAAAALSGTWQCQSPQGPASLVFLDASRLSYNNEISQYAINGNTLWVLVNGAPAAYRFKQSTGKLDIVAPNGEPIRCSKAASATPRDPSEKPATGKLNHLLRGSMCSWSGSSSSGSSYSSSTRVNFDGNGRFSTGSESSFSSGAGAYASQGGNSRGSYRVTAIRIGAAVELLWDSGGKDVAYIHHIYQGQIAELKYGNKVFGAALCN